VSDIKDKVQRIKNMQEKLTSELQQLQASCPHENKQGEYKGDTGNWSSSDDSYWIDARCLDCGKTWIIDSVTNKLEYYDFKGVIVR